MPNLQRALPILLLMYTLTNCITSCPAGYECYTGAQYSCNAGYYSLAEDMACHLCPAGYQCPGGGTPIACGSGLYSEIGVSSCTSCPLGFTCSGGIKTKCGAGTYTPSNGAACTTCEQNYRCPDPKAHIACLAGEWAPPSSTVCYVCPPGATCTPSTSLAASTVTICAAGKYFNGATCANCLAGNYCPDVEIGKLPCPDGTYQDLAGQTSCKLCTAGKSCDVKNAAPVDCAPGTFADSLGRCTTCLANLRCVISLIQMKCNLWEYIAASGACTVCPIGSWCNGITATTCADGSYTTTTGEVACFLCPKGYQCTSSTIARCGTGTYKNTTGSGTCNTCDKGYFCPDAYTIIECPDGTYNNQTNQVACILCPNHKDCTNKASTPADCIPGKYNYGAGPCKACHDQYICTGTADPAICAVGYYCTGNVQNICEAGYYCVAGLRYQCADGYYNIDQGKTTCTVCPQNYYCPTNAKHLSPTQCTNIGGYATYSPAKSTTSAACTACAIGEYCDGADYYRRTYPCQPGTYAYLNSNATTTCFPCPAGYSCDGSTTKTTCVSGQYSEEGEVICHDCPAGKRCPYTTLPLELPCEYGYYQPNGIRQAACIICPVHFECRDLVNAVACPKFNSEQSYYSIQGTSLCKLCPAGFDCTSVPISMCSSGYYSREGESNCQTCPIGHYCPTGSGDPIPCPPGKYNPSTGSALCIDDSTGKYTDFIGQTAQYDCPLGYECLHAWSPPKVCNIGYYSNGNLTSCLKGPEGTYYDAGTYTSSGVFESAYLCPLGYYCTFNSSDIPLKIPCPAGTFGTARGQSSSAAACSTCLVGYYCPTGTVIPLRCKRGYYCPLGTTDANQYPCPVGYYSPTYGITTQAECKGVGDANLCPVGTYCSFASPYPIDCPPGSYCAGGTGPVQGTSSCPIKKYSSAKNLRSVTDCIDCPSGSYCPAASVFPTPCPPGTYHTGDTSITAIYDSTQCTNCLAGYACPKYGNRMMDYVVCRPGYYCPDASKTAKENACPEGTYSDTYRNPSQASCLTCPLGYYCTAATNSYTNPKVICPQGYVCTGGNKLTNITKCPAGTYSERYGLNTTADCITCPPGYMCEAGTVMFSTPCSSGYYCPPGSSLSNRQSCPQGTYFDATGARWDTECIFCVAGAICPLGSASPTPCAVGTYNQVGGKYDPLDCKTCPAGFYCPTIKTVNPIPCGLGYYSDAGATACVVCVKGSFCNTPTTTNATVFGGTNWCAQGYICDATQIGQYPHESLYCPIGFYCPGGADRYHKVSCNAGYYLPFKGAKSSTECVICPAGYYCSGIFTPSVAPSAPDGMCLEGYFCITGKSDPRDTACPEGTFRNMKGGKELADCGTCPAGFYCPQGTNQPYNCPLGQYCAEGSKFPMQCPQGTFGNQVNLRGVDECVDCYSGRYCSKSGLTAPEGLCDPGYYCTTKQIYSNTNPCQAGGYCPIGSKTAIACDVGYYGGSTLKKKVSTDCPQCPGGSYCIGEVNTQATGTCLEGYFCAAGSSNNTNAPATPGYYATGSPADKIACGYGYYQMNYAQNFCYKCPAGYLCQTTNDASTFTDCSAGYYCPGGVYTGNYTSCSPGTFNPNVGGRDSSACVSVPPGYYTGGYGYSSLNGCPASYSCPEGSTTYTNYCDAYYYCPANSGREIPCPPGFSNTSTGSYDESQCSACPAGSYCDGTGTAPKPCDVGYFCPAGSKSPRPSNNVCPIGSYCPQGTGSAIQCPAGKFQPSKGMGYCLWCLKGYYCTLGCSYINATNICPQGYYCPEGTESMYANACPSGTYFNKTGAAASNNCVKCPSGYYCSAGTITPSNVCPNAYYCYTGGWYVGCPGGDYCVGGAAYPFPCPLGKYCTSTTAIANCIAGYYCTGLQTTYTTHVCGAGYTCPAGSGEPVPCLPGTYSSGGSGSCSDCANGKYCGTTKLTSTTANCAAGYYCSSANQIANIRPANYYCTKGYYCASGTNSQTACTGSYYTDVITSSAYKTCPAGYYCDLVSKIFCVNIGKGTNIYCPAGSDKTTSCNAGTINLKDGSSTSGDCIPCPAGSYCPGLSAKAKVIYCPEGKYCPPGSQSPADCTSGYYCPAGAPAQIPCPPGKYCDAGNLTPALIGSKICSAGAICAAGSSSAAPLSCSAGYYCPAGTTEQISCPIGTYRSTSGGSSVNDCTSCLQGYACNNRGISSPDVNCPAGFYCPTKTSAGEMYQCPAGAQCPGNTIIYDICAHGFFQPLPMQSGCSACTAGYYCNNSATTDSATRSLNLAISPGKCPKGRYCPAGTDFPKPCPVGTFSSKQGLDDSTDCEPCAAGHYCPSLGQTETDDTMLCNAGYYCKGGAKSATPNDANNAICPQGNYCPQGSSVPMPCPPGSYTDDGEIGLPSIGSCRPCPANYFCPARGYIKSNYGLFTSSFKCRAGYVCISGAFSDSPTDNVRGRFCYAGNYSDFTAGIVENPCQVGTYNPNKGQSSCISCSIGKLCNITGLAVPYNCPVGYYCSGGASTPTPCPAGSYSNIENREYSTDCLSCDPGKYCLGGKSAPDNVCSAGFICTRGSATPTPNIGVVYDPYVTTKLNAQCPQGYYCPAGSKSPLPCEEGKYQDTIGQSTCKTCISGYYCDELALTAPYKKCSRGHICFAGSTTQKPTNEFTEHGRLCKIGYYCPEGATTDIPCPAGSYEPRQGQYACQTCPLGYYCPYNATGRQYPIECPQNKYCPTGCIVPINCPNGTYSSSTGLQQSIHCRPCPAGKYCYNGIIQGLCTEGYYCDMGAISPSEGGRECPIGYYCGAGVSVPSPCPYGKTRVIVGGKVESDCTSCPEGYYCILGNPVPYLCPKGYFCPAGSFEPTACPAAYYSAATGQGNNATCIICPAGTYCNDKGIANYNQYLCPPGSYCTGGNTAPFPCPSGTYRDRNGASKPDECLICPGGNYCLENTVSPVTCQEGTYCPEGSSIPKICPGGYFCVIASRAKAPCPGAYYCPQSSAKPIKCQVNYYCEPLSAAPTPCPAGTTGSGTTNNDNVGTACQVCGPGFYNDATSATETNTMGSCFECIAGYVCLTGCTKKHPVNKTSDYGYQCPRGYYCPQGSYEATPCPAGMFGGVIMARNWTECFYCTKNTYNNLIGQEGCRPCGPTSSNSEVGQLSCICKGKNRIFQLTDGSCPCKPGHTVVNTDEAKDGLTDCTPIIFQQCSAGYSRSANGTCIQPIAASGDCANTCKDGKGKMSIATGICLCDSVVSAEEACNSECRSSVPQVTVNPDGGYYYYDPIAKSKIPLELSKSDGIQGEPICKKSTGACNVASISMSNSGQVNGRYGPSPTITAIKNRLKGRRLGEAVSGTINNPSFCLYKGDTMTFDIPSKTHYPIYLKDSLVNTNPSFDYSLFTDLAQRMQNSETISVFSFTFSSAGTYIFADSSNNAQQMIISIMDNQQKCPDDDKILQPITSQSLQALGISQLENYVTTTSKWPLIGLVIALFIGVPMLVWLLGVIQNQTSRKYKGFIFNRILPGKINADETNLIRKDEEEEDYIDPNIFKDILKQIKLQTKNTKTAFDKLAKEGEDMIKSSQQSIAELKESFKGKVRNIMMTYGKDVKKLFDQPEQKNANIVETDESDTVQKSREEIEKVLDKDNKFSSEYCDLLSKKLIENEKVIFDDAPKVEERQLKELKRQLDEHYKLSDADKKQLLMQAVEQQSLLRKKLEIEQQSQKAHIVDKLKERSRKRELLMSHLNKVYEEQQERVKESNDKIDDIQQKLNFEKKEVCEQCENEMKGLREEIEEKLLATKNQLRAKCTSNVKSTSDQLKIAEYMNKFNKDIQALEEKKIEEQKKVDLKCQQMTAERSQKIEEITKEAQTLLENEAQVIKSLEAQNIEDKDLIKKMIANQENEEKIRVALESVLNNNAEGDIKEIREEYKQSIDNLREEEERLLKETRDTEAVNDQKEYDEIRKITSRLKETAVEDQKRIDEVHAEYTTKIKESDSEIERQTLSKKKGELITELTQRMLTHKEKSELLIRERVEERKSYKKQIETAIKNKKEAERSTLLAETYEKEHAITIKKAEQILADGLSIINAKFSETEKPQAIDHLLHHTQSMILISLLTKHMREIEYIMRSNISKYFMKKETDIANIKDSFEDKYRKNKRELEANIISEEDYQYKLREIKGKESDKINDLEVQIAHLQAQEEESNLYSINKRINSELVMLKEEQLKEREQYLSKIISSNLCKQYYIGDINWMKKEINLYREKLDAELEAKKQEIQKRKCKLEGITQENEIKLKAIEETVNQRIKEYKRRTEDAHQKKLKELETTRNTKEKALLLRAKNDQEKKKLLEEHMKEMLIMQNAIEDERRRQKDELEVLLKQRMMEKEAIRKKKDEQIVLFKLDQKEAAKQLLNIVVNVPKFDDIIDNKPAVDSKFEELKQKFEKEKMLKTKIKEINVGFNRSNEMLAGAFESKLEKIYKEKSKDKSKNMLESFDFDVLLNRVSTVSNKVEQFSDTEFDKLRNGMREMAKKLDDIKS